MMQEINLSSLGKDLSGFVIAAKTGVYYNNGSFSKTNLDGVIENITPKIQGYYVPIPRSWITEAMLIEEGEDNKDIITNKELLDYNGTIVYNFVKRSSNLRKTFQTVPNFMRERYFDLFAKGWLPLKSVVDTFIPHNEIGILVY